MKKAIFVILWMLAAFLVGCVVAAIYIVITSSILTAQGEPLPSLSRRGTPLGYILLSVNFLIVYAPPVLALVLGVRGKLPGTGSSKPTSGVLSQPHPPSTMAPPPFLPPVLSSLPESAKQLNRDELTAVLESVIDRKFGQDRSLLDPDLFALLMFCIVDKKTFNFIAAQSGRPTEQDIASFEQTIGFPFPKDFRAFVKTGFSCLFLEVNESVWPRPKLGDIVPAWHMMYAIYVYGLSTDVPDYMDIRKQFGAFSKDGRRLVPFMRLEGYRDQYCFTPDGGIIEWRADTREAKPVALTFTALLIKEIETILDRAKKIQYEPNPYAEFGKNPESTGE